MHFIPVYECVYICWLAGISLLVEINGGTIQLHTSVSHNNNKNYNEIDVDFIVLQYANNKNCLRGQ